MTGQDEVTEPWCKSFDVTFDPFGHVNVGTVRNVAIRPAGMTRFGRTCRIHVALLRHQDERRIGVD